jgi:hypothetical protein
VSERGRRSQRYPYDLQEVQIPAEAMEAARRETYRFVVNYSSWQGDVLRLCALCYLQGAFDGAQVQAQQGMLPAAADKDTP